MFDREFALQNGICDNVCGWNNTHKGTKDLQQCWQWGHCQRHKARNKGKKTRKVAKKQGK